MKHKIKEIIEYYIVNKITLKEFEAYMIDLISNYSNKEISNYLLKNKYINEEIQILNDILEDIAYTTTGKLSNEDKENNLITEKELKFKLKKFLQNSIWHG